MLNSGIRQDIVDEFEEEALSGTGVTVAEAVLQCINDEWKSTLAALALSAMLIQALRD